MDELRGVSVDKLEEQSLQTNLKDSLYRRTEIGVLIDVTKK